MNYIEKIASPRSVAIVGASSHPDKVGRQILDNIIDGGFRGKVFPINTKAEPIRGLPTFATILDVHSSIDMVIIAIPAEFVLAVVNQCVQKRVKSVVIITAGFAEINAAGRQLQEQIAEICQRNNIALLGPNCLGFVNNQISLNATFAGSAARNGNISLISQSGAIISSLVDWSKYSQIGFSKIFSLGNKALVREADLLEYLYHDKDTKVIITYLESLEIDEKLNDVLRRYAKTKPTICLFGGRSKEGARAVHSHTGSIVDSYLALEIYLSEAGVIMMTSIEQLLTSAQMFSCFQSIKGRNIAILTNAGGPGITTADAIAESSLKIAVLSPGTKNKLRNFSESESSVNNPVDILGNASDVDYERALSIILKDSAVDGAIVLLTPQAATRIKETAEVICHIKSQKPVVSSFIGGMLYNPAKQMIECSKRPCYPFPNEAVEALEALADFSLQKSTLSHARAEGSSIFEPEQLEHWLKEFDLPAIEYIDATTVDEAVFAAHKIGFPVVLKSGDTEIHKTESGKVFLDLDNDISVKIAFQKVGAPVIVGTMLHADFELFLGLKKHPKIGTIVIFGTGGRYAEIYNDFSYRIAPITRETALQMIHETKIGQILSGVRNQTRHDIEKLAEIIVNSSRFANNFLNISEIDFNPIVVVNDKYHLVDTRIILKEEESKSDAQ